MKRSLPWNGSVQGRTPSVWTGAGMRRTQGEAGVVRKDARKNWSGSFAADSIVMSTEDRTTCSREIRDITAAAQHNKMLTNGKKKRRKEKKRGKNKRILRWGLLDLILTDAAQHFQRGQQQLLYIKSTCSFCLLFLSCLQTLTHLCPTFTSWDNYQPGY